MSNKPAIPEWQRASASAPADNTAPSHEQEEANAQQPVEAPTPTEDDVVSQDGEEDSSESASLLEQASRFLDDPAIRDAPREKKVAFLESKGVSAEDIGRLLGEDTRETSQVEIEHVGERAWSSVSKRCSLANANTNMLSHPQSPQRHLKSDPNHARYLPSSPTPNSWQVPRSRRPSSQPNAF